MAEEFHIESDLKELSKKLLFHDLLTQLDDVLYSDLFVKLCNAYLHPKLESEAELPMESPVKVSTSRIYTESTIQLLVICAVNEAESNDNKMSTLLKMFIDAHCSCYDYISPFIGEVRTVDMKQLGFFMSTFDSLVGNFKVADRQYILFNLLSFVPKMLIMENVIEKKEKTNAMIIASADGKFGIFNQKMFDHLTEKKIVRSDETLSDDLHELINDLTWNDLVKGILNVNKRDGTLEMSDPLSQTTIDLLESYSFTSSDNRCRFEIKYGKDLNCYTTVLGFTKMKFDLDILVRLHNIVDLKQGVEKIIAHGKNMLFFKLKETDLYIVITFYGTDKKGDGAKKEGGVSPDIV